MDTKKVWPETIISGFFYFTGVIVIIMRLFGLCEEQILQLIKSMPDMNTGILTMLSAGIIGGSYLFGHLAGGLMAGLFDFIGKHIINNKQVVNREDRRLVKILSRNEPLLAEALQGRYAAKYFYRSMLGGILFVSIAIISCGYSHNWPWAVWIIAAVLLILFSLAFCRERKKHSSLLKEIVKHNK